MRGTIYGPDMHTLEVELLLPSLADAFARLEEDLPRVCPSCGAVVPGDVEPDWAATWRLYDCWHQGSST
jgi:hypothetical protein